MTDYVTAFLERERRRVAHELEAAQADCDEAATRLQGARKARASYSDQYDQLQNELELRAVPLND